MEYPFKGNIFGATEIKIEDSVKEEVEKIILGVN